MIMKTFFIIYLSLSNYSSVAFVFSLIEILKQITYIKKYLKNIVNVKL